MRSGPNTGKDKSIRSLLEWLVSDEVASQVSARFMKAGAWGRIQGSGLAGMFGKTENLHRILHACRSLCYLVCVLLSSQSLYGYKGASHQQLTFSAARHLNACAEQLNILPLSPLQVRYIARSNVSQASPGFFKSLWRWNYYERDTQRERLVVGLVNTRMHDEFNDVLRDLPERSKPAKKYSDLGKVVSYIQDMTSPAHVVPIFYTRFWRFNISDRFNNYSIDIDQVEKLLPDMCEFAKQHAQIDMAKLLVETAEQTLTALQKPIDGLPASWQAFWKLDEQADDWGEYGLAGNNFGRKVDFLCGEEKCVLLKDDPLYRDFAIQQHVLAVKSTILAMYWMQRSMLDAQKMDQQSEVEQTVTPQS